MLDFLSSGGLNERMSTKRANLIILLGILGIIASGYLTFLHIALMRGELVGGIGCGGEGLLNCHAVTASRWGQLLGMPLSLWGIIGYAGIIGLAALAKQATDQLAQKYWTLLTALAGIVILADLFLLGVMIFEIKHLCGFCLATYALNGVILFLACSVAGNPLKALVQSAGALGALVAGPSTSLFWCFILLAAAGSVSIHLSTVYVQRGSLSSMLPQIKQYLSQQSRVEVPRGDSPTKGEGSGAIEIIEFSDMLCPVCQKAAKMVNIVLANYRKDAVMVFKHFPLDAECNTSLRRTVHPGACRLAAASVCADRQGKFWEFHDRIFTGDGVYEVNNLDQDVADLGLDLDAYSECMTSGEGMQKVRQDVAEGIRVGVQSTPTFVMNGYVIRGSLSPNAFDDFISAIKGAN